MNLKIVIGLAVMGMAGTLHFPLNIIQAVAGAILTIVGIVKAHQK